MKEINFSTSACRYCGFYKPEGRRGGSCQMLGVPVESSWKACSLATSPFKTALRKLEDMFQMPPSVPLNSSPIINKSKKSQKDKQSTKLKIDGNSLSIPIPKKGSELEL